jgi:hypothetical protein
VTPPPAIWRPRQQNRPPKPSDGKKRTVLRVEWPKISGFPVRWPKPNFGYSSMAKNGLLHNYNNLSHTLIHLLHILIILIGLVSNNFFP